MKIYIVNRLMGVKFGGGENFDVNLAKFYLSKNFEVEIITGGRGAIPDWVPTERKLSVKLIKVPYIRRLHYFFQNGTFFSQKIGAIFLELDLLIFEIFCFIYLRNKRAFGTFHLCGLPRLGLWLKQCSKVSDPRKRVIQRWPGPPSQRYKSYMEACDHVIANGDAFQYLESLGLTNLTEVPIGVDAAKFYPLKDNGDLLSKTRLRILYVGRIVPIKDLSTLAKAVKILSDEIPEISLDLVGGYDYNERQKIEKILLTDKVHVKFWGHVSRDVLPKCYQNADIFVLTSAYDNFPNVVLEAMSSGLPIIATNVGGLSKQVDCSNGILVSPGSVKEIAEAIKKLASDKELRIKMGQNGREKAISEFGIRMTFDKILGLH